MPTGLRSPAAKVFWSLPSAAKLWTVAWGKGSSPILSTRADGDEEALAVGGEDDIARPVMHPGAEGIGLGHHLGLCWSRGRRRASCARARRSPRHRDSPPEWRGRGAAGSPPRRPSSARPCRRRPCRATAGPGPDRGRARNTSPLGATAIQRGSLRPPANSLTLKPGGSLKGGGEGRSTRSALLATLSVA